MPGCGLVVLTGSKYTGDMLLMPASRYAVLATLTSLKLVTVAPSGTSTAYGTSDSDSTLPVVAARSSPPMPSVAYRLMSDVASMTVAPSTLTRLFSCSTAVTTGMPIDGSSDAVKICESANENITSGTRIESSPANSETSLPRTVALSSVTRLNEFVVVWTSESAPPVRPLATVKFVAGRSSVSVRAVKKMSPSLLTIVAPVTLTAELKSAFMTDMPFAPPTRPLTASMLTLSTPSALRNASISMRGASREPAPMTGVSSPSAASTCSNVPEPMSTRASNVLAPLPNSVVLVMTLIVAPRPSEPELKLKSVAKCSFWAMFFASMNMSVAYSCELCPMLTSAWLKMRLSTSTP